ncbi:hypothetical protein ACWOE3_12485 [Enterococcus dispar]|uniref:Excisionase n=1 Tax=Enterococcus dispar ATCC 51266 TaxID=1139219 RepID=S0KDM2_9ENTE|nr:hypothetical protein [Enterococcus dispar]EOT42782.1 hypothetical protein OMK_01143 [Enterococcus dispar ATCC 51266]EOW84767.1 hypothetical protein I569_00056 [Enterococcus dispar ATCC 51266]
MQPTLKELIHSVESKQVAAEWDRPEELMKRFNGLKKSTLYDYLKEMDSIPEFKQGIMRPGVTFIHIGTFIWYLRWKEASRYRSKKPSPSEVLRCTG